MIETIIDYIGVGKRSATLLDRAIVFGRSFFNRRVLRFEEKENFLMEGEEKQCRRESIKETKPSNYVYKRWITIVINYVCI